MDKSEKRKLALVGIIILAILLWLFRSYIFARFRPVNPGTVAAVTPETTGDVSVPGIDVPNYSVDLPPLGFSGGSNGDIIYYGGDVGGLVYQGAQTTNNNSTGCSLCAAINSALNVPISQPQPPAPQTANVAPYVVGRNLSYGSNSNANKGGNSLLNAATTRLF